MAIREAEPATIHPLMPLAQQSKSSFLLLLRLHTHHRGLNPFLLRLGEASLSLSGKGKVTCESVGFLQLNKDASVGGHQLKI